MVRAGTGVAWLGAVLGSMLAVALAAVAAVPDDIHHGAGGSFIDFTPRGTQPGLFFGLQLSSGCNSCHSRAPGAPEDPPIATDQFPVNSWSGSMMANATRDPLFWAALDVANNDGLQHGAEGIGDYCLRCHTPDAWYAGRVRKLQDIDPNGPIPPGAIVDGFNGCMLEGLPDDPFGQHDYGGVGCHFCHRVTAEGPGGEPPFLENGDVWLDDSECDSDGDGVGDGEPCRAGPYNYPEVIPGFGSTNPPPHAWKHSPLHSDSGLCGSCHDVTTPMLESGPFRTLIVADGSEAGNDTGLPYPVERTYSEWQRSDYATVLFRDGIESDGEAVPGRHLSAGATCQDCHMRQAQVPAGVDDPDLQVCTFGPPRNGDLAVHEFAGGNTWVPGILKGEYPNLELSAAFDRTIGWATELLTERTALVATQVAPAPGGGLTLAVDVTNLSGHKLPTGYGEGRRMWLDVQVRDANDQVLWRNGAWNPATGELSIDAQTKIYEIKQGIWDADSGTCSTVGTNGKAAFHFVLNDCIAKDNRIPPLGFTGAADPELAPYGYTYAAEPGQPGRSSNVDRTLYAVPAAALQGSVAYPLQVEATLHYQTASREYIEFLRDQAVDNGFQDENTLCADNPARPFPGGVGAQDKTRGEYMYELWTDPAYGRSPPVAVASASASFSQ